jgi:hypothetical protein
MKLSSVREGLPFELISRHVKSHQDEEREYDDLTRPEQLNVQADHRATEALDELRADDTITEFYPIPTCGSYLATAPGISPVTKYARSEPNSPSTSSERTFRDATTGQTRSMIPSVGLLTDQPMPDSLTISGHSWSNLVMGGYPLAYANDDAVVRLIHARNVAKSRLFLIFTAASPEHSGATGL